MGIIIIIIIIINIITVIIGFSALTLLAGHQEELSACKKYYTILYYTIVT